MKAKKLPLLLALIALIGTFSSVIPQNTFATDLSENAFCIIIPTPNTDTHSLGAVVTNSNVDVGATYRAANNQGDNQAGDLARSNLIQFTLFRFDAQNNLVFVSAQPAINDPPTIPRQFNIMFPGLDDGRYIVFACGDEVLSGELPDPVRGPHHGDSARFIIDTINPTISCSPLNFAADANDGQTIPRTDSRFTDFFGVDVVVNDNLDDNLDVTDNAPANIPVGQTVPVTFRATDDVGNFAEATCNIFIEPFKRAGCEGGRILDQTGAPLEIEICEEVNVRQADCGLGILGNNPTLSYGALNQGDTSAAQSLFVINTGNAPALLKVIAGDPLAVPPTPGAWIDPTEVGAPPFTPEMLAAQTHFSTLDPTVVGPDDAAFYDSASSFAVSDTVKKILIPILGPQVVEELFWQLRIILLEPLSFGDFQQTLTLELQQCSLANQCEIFGLDCPLTGDPFIER